MGVKGKPAVIELFYERHPNEYLPSMLGQSGCVEDLPAPSRLRLHVRAGAAMFI